MVVRTILYHPKFIRDLRALESEVRKRAVRIGRTFKSDPLHPSLRLHALKGRLKGSWTISVTMKVRIIFTRMKNGDIVFYSIGTHDIYKNL